MTTQFFCYTPCKDVDYKCKIGEFSYTLFYYVFIESSDFEILVILKIKTILICELKIVLFNTLFFCVNLL
jgi:hypothetical protein